MKTALDGIKALFVAKGGRQYSGEAVTQLEHALQSARLAEEAGASKDLITACLLHDFAHEAVKLRRWDDLAKAAGRKTPDLRHYLEIAASCVSVKSPA